MAQVIYIDILVILNTYIGFFLLCLTKLFCRAQGSRLRLFASALLQGGFSLVIFLPPMSGGVLFLVRLSVCGIFILAAFAWHGVKEFLRLFAVFFAVNFSFAGIMTAIWFFIAPGGMAYNNGTVYFNISAMTLAFSSTGFYLITRLIMALVGFQSPKGSLCSLTITAFDTKIQCRALIDSGNHLAEPFSGLPVIIADKALFPLPEDLEQLPKFRMIPCSTVNAESILYAFRPVSVEISCTQCSFLVTEVYIGFSKTPLKRGEFSALIPPELINNAKERKGFVHESTR